MKKMLLSGVTLLILAFIPTDRLTGRWESKPSEKGNVTGVVFKENGTLEGYINKKPFVSGNYSFKGDTLSFTDNGCSGALAVYKVDFFSNGDSIRFKVIDDTCTDRRNGITRLILGKVK